MSSRPTHQHKIYPGNTANSAQTSTGLLRRAPKTCGSTTDDTRGVCGFQLLPDRRTRAAPAGDHGPPPADSCALLEHLQPPGLAKLSEILADSLTPYLSITLSLVRSASILARPVNGRPEAHLNCAHPHARRPARAGMCIPFARAPHARSRQHATTTRARLSARRGESNNTQIDQLEFKFGEGWNFVLGARPSPRRLVCVSG
jgi:hypothetical protein